MISAETCAMWNGAYRYCAGREPATLRLGPQVALVGHPEFSHMEAEDLMNYERF